MFVTVANGSLRRLDASVGASGPYDFAVRKHAPSSEAPPASIASRSASVTIAIRPCVEQDGKSYELIWVAPERIYFRMWVSTDKANHSQSCGTETLSGKAAASAQKRPYLGALAQRTSSYTLTCSRGLQLFVATGLLTTVITFVVQINHNRRVECFVVH